ncbi:MAG TPA: hypothetical protein VKY31_05010, partial [Terriglobia bacterium]|nr:hypothetical protein [Terriglobia bacterium]
MSIVPKQPFGSGHNDEERTRIAGKYVHEKSGTYFLELGPSGNFVLFQDSEIIGRYDVHGGVVTLFVAGKPISTAKLVDGGIIDDQGDRWVRAIAPPVTPPVERAPQIERPPQVERTLQPERQPERQPEPGAVAA